MATVVQFEEVIDAQNQGQPGGGLHNLSQSACPDLYALTKAGPEGSRMLPVGWKLLFLTDSSTGDDKGMMLKAPDGRTWSLNQCQTGSVSSPAGKWSWVPAVLFGIAFYYLLTKKK